MRPALLSVSGGLAFTGSLLFGLLCGGAGSLSAQVLTVETNHIDGRAITYKQTAVPLPTAPATIQTRQELIRSLGSEQGFAMLPMPMTTKGVILQANGRMSPDGSSYVAALKEKGIGIKAGDRATITDVQIKGHEIVLDLNGGPERKHKFLRHIEVGAGGAMTPLARTDDPEPSGARLTLVFPKELPDVTGEQVMQLLAPLIGFNVKSPAQAYAEKLPPFLKKAVLEHHVLVGMSTEMVLHAVGQPQQKIREREGQTPFEEWIYGAAPERVEFVRLTNERVTRVEDALVGEPPVIRATNEVGDYWQTENGENTRMVKLGDQSPLDRAQQSAPKAPPTLRRPGEVLQSDRDPSHPTPQAVQFPKGMDKPGSSSGAPAPAAAPAPNTAPTATRPPAPSAPPPAATPPPAPVASSGPAPTSVVN